jgi:hypothetical protein
MTGIGNKPVGMRLDAPAEVQSQVVERAPLGDRVLAALATWVRDDGTVVEPTTSSIAARLDIAPRSYERDELETVLRRLRERRLVKYELDHVGDICWRLSHEGWSLARRLKTGVTGMPRSTDDRHRDRFSQVVEGTTMERRPGR